MNKDSPRLFDETGMHRWTMDCHPLSQFFLCWYWNWHLESTFISVCPEHALAYLIPVKNWLIFPSIFLGHSPTQIFHGNFGNLESPHQVLLEFKSSFSGKTLRCFFTHGKSEYRPFRIFSPSAQPSGLMMGTTNPEGSILDLSPIQNAAFTLSQNPLLYNMSPVLS
jgi:hypothetical protein